MRRRCTDCSTQENLTATGNVEDADTVDAGGYLLELDESYYTQQQAYVILSDGKMFTVRNPKYASENMVEYISEL